MKIDEFSPLSVSSDLKNPFVVYTASFVFLLSSDGLKKESRNPHRENYGTKEQTKQRMDFIVNVHYKIIFYYLVRFVCLTLFEKSL